MSIKLYMDVHVRRAITVQLRLRGLDVLTAQEDDAARLPDPQLLDRALELDRVSRRTQICSGRRDFAKREPGGSPE